jgi:hypothetical protein
MRLRFADERFHRHAPTTFTTASATLSTPASGGAPWQRTIAFGLRRSAWFWRNQGGASEAVADLFCGWLGTPTTMWT